MEKAESLIRETILRHISRLEEHSQAHDLHTICVPCFRPVVCKRDHVGVGLAALPLGRRSCRVRSLERLCWIDLRLMNGSDLIDGLHDGAAQLAADSLVLPLQVTE